MESYLPGSLSESLGTPSIASTGAIYNVETVELMKRAADELNITLAVPRYEVVLSDDSMLDEYGKVLSDDYQRVRVQGTWIEDNDLSELWDRTKELRAEVNK